ncbi:MAG: hypothetical protein FWH14_01220 [Oscillospiraceae bacterium]|nr:hypothetical protein [Oscillospiraceae bacterium]
MKKLLILSILMIFLIGGSMVASWMINHSRGFPPDKMSISTDSMTRSSSTSRIIDSDPLGSWWNPLRFDSLQEYSEWAENTDWSKTDYSYEMITLDRFYLIPEIPESWEFDRIHIRNSVLNLYFKDTNNNKYTFGYGFIKRDEEDILNGFNNANFTTTINGIKYIIIQYQNATEGYIDEWSIRTNFGEYWYKFDFSGSLIENGDVIGAAEKLVRAVPIKRIDLPPLE